jgi:nitrogen fixation/metabolism regulation signal transduction histidine kinase
MKQPRSGLVLAISLVAGLAGLALLSQTVQNSETYGRWHETVLLANVAGMLLLLGLLAINLRELLVEHRQAMPGARLRLRMLAAFVALSTAPVLVVYLVAVQFLHRGIETWLDDRIATGLDEAIELSRTALDPSLNASLMRTRNAAAALTRLTPAQIAATLPKVRQRFGADEMTVFGNNYRIVGASAAGPARSLRQLPTDEMSLQLRRAGSFVSLDPVENGRLRIRAAVTFTRAGKPGGELLTLQALFPVGDKLGALVSSIQATSTRYRELVFLREPLESSFTVALSVVVLLTLLAALYGAFVFARRLAAPLQSLVAGTKAVAAGNLDTRLPVTTHDDIGLLVESFNAMTEQLASARDQSRRDAQEVERARASLAAVLGRLTSGVLALQADGRLRIANEAAGSILHADFSTAGGRPLAELAATNGALARLLEASAANMQRAPEGWREQIVIPGETGRRVLMCAATPLPDDAGGQAGVLLVFDDITALIQAQREAAWGEVARRLAHEIKNPLTPIQLSAERIRRRYLPGMEAANAEVLDRATHTIVQQVEAMRDMVNAFSEYARSPEMSVAPVDVNALVREVADLYHAQHQPELRLDLDPGLGTIEADAVRLRQLLHNLIRNAGEALGEAVGGRIEITTRRCAEAVADKAEIRISDNGPGIDPALLDRVFEPYVTSKSRGTGLGLAIVRRLVEEHGGTVSAENSAGGGACLTVVLPVSQRNIESQAEVRPRRAGDRR